MTISRLPCVLAAVLCAAAALPAAPKEPEADAADVELLRSAGLGVDGPQLLDYFRKRTVRDVDRERIAALVLKLGDDDFAVREEATAALTALGAAARPQLSEALKSSDVEIVRRAKLCLESLDKVGTSLYMNAAARLLARRNPEGATEVLLAFLPSAEDQGVADEIALALAKTAFRDGKPDAALLKALADKSPARRAAAAEALCHAGGAEQRPAARKLLGDADPAVRLRVALALFEAKDKDSVPVLIAALSEAPRDLAWRAEDALYRVAGDKKVPEGGLSGDDDARRKYREEWEAWWKQHGAGVDLAKLEAGEKNLGLTLLAQMDMTGTNGRVLELDRTGKVRWQIENIPYPIDAQLLRGGDKVLVTQYSTRLVTERNLKGEVLWQKQVNTILFGARRLPNGNTFIVTRTQLLEVNPDGKEVRTINRNDITAAVKLRDGQIGVLTTQGAYVRLDETGKELKSFKVANPISTIGTHIEVLPNGRVLIPDYGANRVAEFDADGKQLWTAAVQQPSSVARLPNGNTLVASRINKFVVELDRAGKEVRRHTLQGRPMSLEYR